MVLTPVEMLLRMATSVVLGGAVGYEREQTGRPAGLRTHLLVALASSTFMLVSTQFVYFQHYGPGDLITVDSSRIAASVVSGVGFLGAGAIMRNGVSIQGLTTAATLWLVAAVGLASGGGMYIEAVAATVVALFSLVLLRRFEAKSWRTLRRRMSIVVESGGVGSPEIVALMNALGVVIGEADYDHDLGAGTRKLSFDVTFKDQRTMEQALNDVAALAGIRRVKLQRPG